MSAAFEETSSVVLAPAVRSAVLAFAAAALRSAPEADVPASLRAVRRFTPAKQLRLGGSALARALETDDAFRTMVSGHVRSTEPDLAAAVDDGRRPAAASPVDLAAVAYVLDAPAWRDLSEQVSQEANRASRDEEVGELDRLRREVADLRNGHKAELARVRAELAETRADAEDLRRRLRSAEAAAARSAADLSAARGQTSARLAVEQETAAQAAREADAELRRLRGRLTELETALGTAKRSAREARGLDTVRLRVLLDTVLSATAGLRRELDLPLVVDHPADVVAAASGAGTAGDPLAAVFAARGQAPTDGALVDGVLTAPRVHLLVDGYNVTKTGYPDSTLESQRARLVSGLGALASRNPGAEITCVFDGTAATSRPTALPIPRGVRVLFSAVGELADDLLVRLVRAEPAGRPIAVVTNDGEIISAVRAAGARCLASEALLARLERS
ncbi:MAG: hypothetical protein QOJ32_2419 [Frankiaceae bacterium]|jgi:predicted RNA-binding protein with PIN domain|nr:hypothetical protein [Frankiaceae bacterium]